MEEIRPGDVVWFPPGEKHWHGAAPTTAMTHIAIQEKLDGKPVDWLEHVTAEQYEGRSDASQCVRPFHITSPAPRASPLDGAPVAEEPSRWAVVPYWRLSPGILDCAAPGSRSSPGR